MFSFFLWRENLRYLIYIGKGHRLTDSETLSLQFSLSIILGFIAIRYRAWENHVCDNPSCEKHLEIFFFWRQVFFYVVLELAL